ncbi:unknown [Firmicutes bacterium CAG:822]|nr:unknown [Firmicutes bacterium CAG:822]
MKNKILINAYVVKLDKKYDIYIPIDLPVGEIANLIYKAANILSDNQLNSNSGYAIMDGSSGKFYDLNTIVSNTDIRNGKQIIFF